MRYDGIVIGGGAAGMFAAITAAKRGQNVLLLEKNDRLGRKLLITGKGRCNVTNNCTGQEVLQNVPRNGRFLYSAMTAFPPEKTMAFFEERGCRLKTERGNRVFPVTDKSQSVLDCLQSELHRQKITVKTARVRDILTQDGHVTGVRTQDEEIAANWVILATGGYARNKDMVARYPVAHYFSNVPHGNVGDGLTAAEKLGARNFEHPAVQVVYTSLTNGVGINDESGLIVNDRGERVVNEWSYQYTVSDAIARSGSNCAWYITSGKEPYGGVQYGYKAAVAGKSKDPCAASIEGLAKKMGCDPATLQATYDRYCELVERGVDEDFGKPAEFLHPIKGPKFVALRLHPCVTVTFGGLETDISARVMKPDGSVIPHLYAAGEVAGTGMYGTQYPTCGTSIGSALFYGRIAGRAVTDQALL